MFLEVKEVVYKAQKTSKKSDFFNRDEAFPAIKELREFG
jgi:hypothetical protein